MDYWPILGFVRRHVWGSVFLVGSSLFTVASVLNEAYTYVHAGLPNLVWAAIGAFLFFGTVIALLAQSDQPQTRIANRVNAIATPQSKNVKSVQLIPRGEHQFVLVVSPARGGIELEVYLERSPWMRAGSFYGVGGYVHPGWAVPAKFFLGQLRLRDEGINSSIPVLEHTSDNSGFWVWNTLKADGNPSDTRPAAAHTKERVAFLFKDADRIEEAFRFLLVRSTSDMTAPPLVIEIDDFAPE